MTKQEQTLAKEIFDQMNDDDKAEYYDRRDDWIDGISWWQCAMGVDLDELFRHLDRLVAGGADI